MLSGSQAQDAFRRCFDRNMTEDGRGELEIRYQVPVLDVNNGVPDDDKAGRSAYDLTGMTQKFSQTYLDHAIYINRAYYTS
jgi:hypothetical protein